MGIHDTSKSRHWAFISYTKRESEIGEIRPFLEAVAVELRYRGYAKVLNQLAWVDFDRIAPHLGGEPLKERLVEGIDYARSFLSFVSPEYVASDWCRFEWSYANNSRRAPELYPMFPHDFILPIVWKSTSRDQREQLGVLSWKTIDAAAIGETMEWKDAVSAAEEGRWSNVDVRAVSKTTEWRTAVNGVADFFVDLFNRYDSNRWPSF